MEFACLPCKKQQKVGEWRLLHFVPLQGEKELQAAALAVADGYVSVVEGYGVAHD